MPRAKSTTTKRSSTGPKSASTTSLKEENTLSKTTSETSSNPFQSLKIKRLHILIGTLVVLAIVLLYIFRGLFVAALVNGEPIARLSVVKQLEKHFGQDVSDHLITQKLITQEAREQNITVSEADINAELEDFESRLAEQERTLDEFLTINKLSREEFLEQLELKIMIDRLIGEIEVTDEEVNEFIEQNSEIYSDELDPELVRQQLETEKYDQRYNELLTKLREEAQIEFFVNY